MQIILQLPKDINKFCRTCMSITDCNDSFENHIISDSKLTELGEILQDVTSIKIDVNDCFPTSVCLDCFEKLNQISIFKIQCRAAEENIRALLSLIDPSKLPSGEVTSEQLNLNDVSEKCEDDTPILPSSNSINSKCLLKTDEDNFFCTVCSELFTNQYLLSKHMILHNDKKTLLNRFLDNRNLDFRSCCNDISQIDNDTKTLINDRKFPTLKNNLNNEYKVKEQKMKMWYLPKRDETVSCKLCFKNFESRKELVSHICAPLGDITDNVKFFVCSLCDRTYSDNSSISLHFINHALASNSTIKSDVKSEYVFCEICGETFKSSTLLDNHYSENHTEKPQWQCPKCSLTYDEEINLIKHEAIHMDYNKFDSDKNNSFNCALCNTKFSGRENMISHSFDHLLKNYCCHKCKKTFCTQYSYFAHLKLHPEYDHVCPVCGKHVVTKSALKIHIVGVHSKELHHECNVCHKRFSTQSRLKTHATIHSTHKKYICSYCGYSTHKPGDLQIHNRTHTRERPYKCTFAKCKMTFKTSSHLCSHVRGHLQIRRFKCSVCAMRFPTNHTLKVHLMQHTGEKPFSCLVCHAKFRRKHHLKIHMKQHNKSTD